ncbi:hypothetical protein TPR58_04235 [Sphingomonas sp. HF-S3]|uniref:ABC transmembrane type-1 domain-containing protein n=1 Tax=Sphingomonas rustica TaxID=3103142 RepID=A0ABV0B8I9_9SPHN
MGVALPVLMLFYPDAISPVLGPAMIAFSPLCVVMFVSVVFDKSVREANNRFNATTAKELEKLGFFRSLFSTAYGDWRFLVLNRLAWLEGVVAVFIERKDLAFLALMCFMISTMMTMLAFKRPDSSLASGE